MTIEFLKSIKDLSQLLQSKNKFIRKFYYYFLDHANGKCNLFYSLIPTNELRRLNFLQASGKWEDLSMDRNIVFSLLNRNKVTLNQNTLASLKVDNKKYYLKKGNYNKEKMILNLSSLITLVKDLNLEKNYFINESKNNLLITFIVNFTFFFKVIKVLINRFNLKIFYFSKKISSIIKRSRIEEKAIKRIGQNQIKKKGLSISDTTLVAVATTEVEKAAMALRYSMVDIKFKKVLLIGNYNPWNLNPDIHFELIKPFRDVGEWGKFIVFDLYKFIDTKYIILIHPDGFIVNPDMWDEEFKNYDYVGAPWPKPKDSFSYKTDSGRIIDVGNSVSLRSKRILEIPSLLGLKWESFYGNYHEDGYLCVHNRELLEKNGIQFADKETAYRFGIETFLKEFKNHKAFTFHKWFGYNKSYPNFMKY